MFLGHLDKALDRLQGVRECFLKLDVFLVAPGATQMLELTADLGDLTLKVFGKPLQVRGKTSEFGRIDNSLGHFFSPLARTVDRFYQKLEGMAPQIGFSVCWV